MLGMCRSVPGQGPTVERESRQAVGFANVPVRRDRLEFGPHASNGFGATP